MDPAKEKLFDDLMLDSAPASMPDADEIITLVHRAKAAQRQQFGRWRTVVVSLMLGGGLAAGLLVNERRTRENADQRSLLALEKKSTATVAKRVASQSPVQRLDDEGLLDLLDSTPSALVEWPDGRQTLLLVVGPSPAAN